MEVGAIRRDLGQLILATAILDDTIAWVIIAVIAGIAAHGTVSFDERRAEPGGHGAIPRGQPHDRAAAWLRASSAGPTTT